jgi:DNA-directed RNA polymerase II subunit RPB2
VAFISQVECLQFIGRFVDYEFTRTDEALLDQAKRILRDKLLPHVGQDDNSFRKKAIFVCYMVRRLISAYVGLTDEDDRDHVGRKRIDTTG